MNIKGNSLELPFIFIKIWKRQGKNTKIDNLRNRLSIEDLFKLKKDHILLIFKHGTITSWTFN